MLTFGAIAYGLAAAGFLLLTLLLATSWGGRGQGARLIIACAVNSVWAASLAYASYSQSMQLGWVLLVEFARDAAWLSVLIGLIERGGFPRLFSRLTYGLAGGAVLLAVAIFVSTLRNGPYEHAPQILILGGLFLSLAALVLLEQIFRNASQTGRYTLKYFVIGIGALFAYDLFLFSQGQLVKGVEVSSWEARGLVNALAVPLIALAARANPQWSLNVFVSRQVVFYTTSILAIGLYLLFMAVGGYAIRLYGGTWGRIAQIVFFFGAGVVLATLLASTSLRNRLRVFLSKHFYRNKYDYRVEWLRFIETLSSPEGDIEPQPNALRSVAQIISSPGGVLFMPVEAAGGFAPVACWPSEKFSRTDYGVLSDNDELPGFLRRTQWVIDLAEYRSSPDAYQNVLMPDFLEARTNLRLLVPLMQQADLTGFLVLAEPPPPFELTYEDRDLLKTVGRHVATHLAQHEADRLLSESRQFEAYHRLTAFVMHDLKNLAAQLSLLVANAEKHKRNPEFIDDAIGTIANSTTRMQRLIDQLRRREVQSLDRRTSLTEVARHACERCAVRPPVPVLGEAALDAFAMADPERLTMMVEHLIRNAQEATGETGRVSVSVTVRRGAPADALLATGVHRVSGRLAAAGGAAESEEGLRNGSEATSPALDLACLTVTDTGTGMNPEFIKERLFKPFDTTKGSKGMGIGAYQVREYVKSLGGRIQVHSQPGEGSAITLLLPLAEPPEIGQESTEASGSLDSSTAGL